MAALDERFKMQLFRIRICHVASAVPSHVIILAAAVELTAHPARLFGSELLLHDVRHNLGLRAVVYF
jgi:hypothetical protein